MQTPLTVLLVEDSEDDALLLEAMLESSGYHTTLRRVDCDTEYRQQARGDWDVIIADNSLPQFSAGEALAIRNRLRVQTPFLVVSGSIGEQAAVELMRNGASDCIHKDNLIRLPHALNRILIEAENRRARLRAEQELERLAFYDDRTGLPNRRYFKKRLLEDAESGALESVSLIMLQFERLRMVADTLGDQVAEGLLAGIARRLQEGLESPLLIGHLSCEEFAIAYSGQGPWDKRIQDVLALFEAPLAVGRRSLFVRPTLGCSQSSDGNINPDALVRNALAAVHSARGQGADHAFFSPQLEQDALKRLLIGNRLRGAVGRDELSLVYQPKVDLRDGRLYGTEALLRWHDAELGLVSPALFIPVAEETGDICTIGDWVLEHVCAQIRQWLDRGLDAPQVAVNVSARQLREPNFVARASELLQRYGVPAELLELEVTESDIMGDMQLAADLLGQLRAMGIRIAVDDFGTGYSSLAYLKRLPLSSLKIDRSFICDVPGDGDSNAIVEAIVGLAQGLRLNVVAEGVEHEDQVAFLRALGCEQAQGFLFSRPLAPQVLETRLTPLCEERAAATRVPQPEGLGMGVQFGRL